MDGGSQRIFASTIVPTVSAAAWLLFGLSSVLAGIKLQYFRGWLNEHGGIPTPIALIFPIVAAKLRAMSLGIVGQALGEEVACLIVSLEWQVLSTFWSRDMKKESGFPIAVAVCAVGLQRSVRQCLSLDRRELETRLWVSSQESQGCNWSQDGKTILPLPGGSSSNQNAVFVAELDQNWKVVK